MDQKAFLSKEGIWGIFDLEMEEKLSSLCVSSSLPEAFSFRLQRRSRLLAAFLIDEKGGLSQEKLELALASLEKSPYYIYISGYNDSEISRHFLYVLKALKDPQLSRALKKFQKPLCHSYAEKLIRDSLGASSALNISDVHLQRAALSACFASLRQNVGSCFATAPAILIQSEQIGLFLADIYDLLTTGKIKRTAEGTLRMAPLAPSTGSGDLKKTLTQERQCYAPSIMEGFCAAGLIDKQLSLEEKIEKSASIARVHLEKKGALSVEKLFREALLDFFGLPLEKVDLIEKLEKETAIRSRGMSALMPPPVSNSQKEACYLMLQKEKEARSAFKAFTDHPLVKAWEYTLASFSEAKMEFSSWNLYSSLGLNPEERGGIGAVLYAQIQGKLNESNKKTEQLQRNYEIAFDQLRATEALLKQATTEAEIRRLQAEHRSRLYHMHSCLELRDLSYHRASKYAAFFSFLIKQYVAAFQEYFQEIYDPEMQDVEIGEYDDAPAGFRLVYKHGRSDASLWTLIYTPKQYIDALIDFFLSIEPQIAAASDWEEGSQEVVELTTAIVSHLQTGEFLQTALARMSSIRLEKKPWAYLSGGSMSTLLKTYFRRENEITEEARWVEGEIDLLTFLLDVLKTLPLHLSDSFLDNPHKKMLIYSPTHAFLLQPGWELFCKGWQEEIFTYTWIRDQYLVPRQRFYEDLLLPPSAQSFLAKAFSERLPQALAHQFLASYEAFSMSLSSEKVAKRMRQELAEIAPASLHRELTATLDGFLYEMLPLLSSEKLSDALSELVGSRVHKACAASWIGALALKEMAIAAFLEKEGARAVSLDLHAHIAKRAEACGLSSPPPLLFADTNWTGNYFAFVVSPASLQLELWRCDAHGFQGKPMHIWKSYLDGTKKQPWGVYTRPYEYSL